MMFTLDKNYLKEQYLLAMNDFVCSYSENDKWECRKRMARIEKLASEMYGFEFADNLVKECRGDLFYG